MPLKIGISRCLLGDKVRYDGGHKLDRSLRDVLGAFVEYVPVCPEVECGLGVPREAMRLVGDPAAPRLVTQKTGLDLTERMTHWAEAALDRLAGEDLCGFIFKHDSPSSGMRQTKVYPTGGGPATRQGAGIFARLFMERFPLLPVEDEGRLNDPGLRENFIERVFAFRRWRDMLDRGTAAALVDFHSRHKLLLMAHSPKAYRELGPLVARAGSLPFPELTAAYAPVFWSAMRLPATTRKHVNVLMHIMGYFKKQLSGDEKQELLEVIDAFGRGLTPLIVPVTLLNHYVRKHGQDYLAGQAYLNPHPLELKLRNHA